MKQRVADYIVDFLVKKGITDSFSVVGGGSMFLNDAFRKNPQMNCIYNHHEQACTMAAESYYKYKGVMAAVCVTTGPGGTNTITGLLGAYQDSIPLFVISGQVRYATTVESTGLKLRQFGGQEHQIVDTVKNVTKFAEMVRKPEEIRYLLEKAYHVALNGRRGPVWLDVPLDIQNSMIDTDNLIGYQGKNEKTDLSFESMCILNEIKKAKRPVIIVGSAVRTVGKIDEFLELTERLQLPVTYPLLVSDAISAENPLAVGCFGGVGNRAANFVIQNADLLVVLGCRMAFAHIGFNYKAFSQNSKKIVVDIDEAEQEKPTLKRDIKIVADVGEMIEELLKQLRTTPIEDTYKEWREYCAELKNRYPIYQTHHTISEDGRVNPYYMAKSLSDQLTKDSIVVLGNSSGLDPKLQLGIKEQGERVILNCNCGSMGYCLPAGIGAAIASKRLVIVYTGDGCIQMNIQELQTIVHNKLPIKIFVLNNNGYGGVVATQKNFFNGELCGCTDDSGISMPSFEKLAYAYGLGYEKIENHSQMNEKMKKIFENQAPMIIEVLQDMMQAIEPCVASRTQEDGTIISTGIDDMAPFLSLDEYENCQFDNWKRKN